MPATLVRVTEISGRISPLFNHIFHGTLALISFMRISGCGAVRSALSRVNRALLQGLQL